MLGNRLIIANVAGIILMTNCKTGRGVLCYLKTTMCDLVVLDFKIVQQRSFCDSGIGFSTGLIRTE